MDTDLLVAFLLGIALAILGGVASGFFNAAGGTLWGLVHKRFDPSPRERYFVRHIVFKRWKGELAQVYEARRAEGYEFTDQIEGRVPAYETEGWEKMLLDDKEIWCTKPTGVPYAILMRHKKLSS